jgi:hypothetical protein
MTSKAQTIPAQLLIPCAKVQLLPGAIHKKRAKCIYFAEKHPTQIRLFTQAPFHASFHAPFPGESKAKLRAKKGENGRK